MPTRTALVPTLALLAGLAAAAEPPTSPGEILMVVGETQGDAQRLAGTATVLDRALLAAYRPESVHQLLRHIPAATVVDEDGYGMRANIGMRGVNPIRSNKVHVMEDGVPVAPNPYNDPSLYVGPAYARFAAVEAIKGSGQILYGPHTVAGVVNFKTDPLAYAARGSADLAHGSHDTTRVRAMLEVPLGEGLSAAVDAYLLDTAGFRPHDDVNQDEVVARLGWRPSPDHRFEAKLFSGTENSNLTYLGLARDDFARDPHDRYDFTSQDAMEAERRGVHLRHRWDAGDDLQLVTTAYHQHAARVWTRAELSFNGSTYVAAQPTTAGFTRDRSAGDRTYLSQGLESRLHAAVAGAVPLTIDAGARLHREGQDNRTVDHHATTGAIAVRTAYERETLAAAGWLQAEAEVGAGLHLIPGIRVESVEIASRRTLANYAATTDPEGASRVTEALPGFGATWDAARAVQVYGGVHRGFSPPSYSQAVSNSGQDNELDAERSWNYEIGLRLDLGPSLQADLAAFLVDWDNIIAQGVSGGPQINGGESRHRGVEGLISGDLGHAAGLGFAIPFRLAGAWVEATYESDVYAGSTLVARAGNQREFSPELTASASLGIAEVGPRRAIAAHLTLTWIGEQFSDGLNTVAVPASGSTGLIDEVALLDLTVRWQPEGAAYEIYATGRNLADTGYVSYRRGGHGSIAGAPRSAMLGAALRF